jgi:hypothetical protein
MATSYPREYWNRELDLPSDGVVKGVPKRELEWLPDGKLRWFRFFAEVVGIAPHGLLMDEGWGLTAEEEGPDTYTVRWKTPVWADPPWAEMPPLPPAMPGDADGRPLNPLRTNTMPHGRGMLGKWGPNCAVDVVVTATMAGELHALVVKRRDTAQYAFVGGMCGKDANPLVQGMMELREEALSKLTTAQGDYLEMCLAKNVKLCDEPMKDPRNTRHAWMEVTAFHIHIPHTHVAYALELEPAEGEDTTEARWARVSSGQLWPTTDHGKALNMYADHLKYLPLLAQSPLLPQMDRGVLVLVLVVLALCWVLW